MAKAKKQQAVPQTTQPASAAKPAIPPAPAPAASKAAAQPTAKQPLAANPAAIQASGQQPPTQPAEAKSSKKVQAKKGGAAMAADAGNAAPAPKPAPKPAPPRAPIIDTNLAAAAAASMVVHRDIAASATPAAPATGGALAQSEPPRQESASFKQLKQGLSKPAGSVGNLLGTPPGQKKSNLPFGGQKQSFRNQTFGADVNRTGVPRRTGG
jgi:hypothetical protein